jgi:hypothetical protein
MTQTADSVTLIYQPTGRDTAMTFCGTLGLIKPEEFSGDEYFAFKEVYYGRAGQLQLWLNETRDSLTTFFSDYGLRDYLLKIKP